MSEPWNIPITLSNDGSRAVLEANWDNPSDRCQLIFVAQSNGDCLINTCRKDTPSIRITNAQIKGLAYFLRSLVIES